MRKVYSSVFTCYVQEVHLLTGLQSGEWEDEGYVFKVRTNSVTYVFILYVVKCI